MEGIKGCKNGRKRKEEQQELHRQHIENKEVTLQAALRWLSFQNLEEQILEKDPKWAETFGIL